MSTFSLGIRKKEIQADTLTPIGIYLRLRDVYPQCLLLECADYSNRNDAFSYICLKPIAGVEVTKTFTKIYNNLKPSEEKLQVDNVVKFIDSFFKTFRLESGNTETLPAGFYGFTAYDSIEFFENVHIKTDKYPLPLIKYDLYQVILEFNHFNNTLILYEFINPLLAEIGEKVISLLGNRNTPFFPFKVESSEIISISDETFKSMVETGKRHCARGDVFQIVLSRGYGQHFIGDDFNVYRALRTINPSPYLFYFDYLNFKIFGSSPEAHLKVVDGIAVINPIAGTAKRTGNSVHDQKTFEELLKNPKENSEHAMLVDLARNDLSRHAYRVVVDKFREVQMYSHLFHLVSNVRGELKEGTNPYELISSTFPAGTLTGAPKYMAIQLIGEIEPVARGVYGGAVGFIGLNGNVNHAIIIRSFLSFEGVLYYQAGAGVVIGSSPEGELQEVKIKLSALRKAIDYASKSLSNY